MRINLYPLTEKTRAALEKLRDEGASVVHGRTASALRDFGYAVPTGEQSGRQLFAHIRITEMGRERLKLSD